MSGSVQRCTDCDEVLAPGRRFMCEPCTQADMARDDSWLDDDRDDSVEYVQHDSMCGCERCVCEWEGDNPQPVFDRRQQ